MITIPISIVIVAAVLAAVSILSTVKLWQLFQKQRGLYEYRVRNLEFQLSECEARESLAFAAAEIWERKFHRIEAWARRLLRAESRLLEEQAIGDYPLILTAEHWERLEEALEPFAKCETCMEFATWCWVWSCFADLPAPAGPDAQEVRLWRRIQLFHAELELVGYRTQTLLQHLEGEHNEEEAKAAFQTIAAVRRILCRYIERRYEYQHEVEATQEAIGKLLQPPTGERVTPNGLAKEEIMSTTIYDPWQEPEQHPYKRRITNEQGRRIARCLIQAIPSHVLNPGQKSQVVEAYLCGGMKEVYETVLYGLWHGDETNSGFIRFAHAWLATLIPISWNDFVFVGRDSIMSGFRQKEINWEQWQTWGKRGS